MEVAIPHLALRKSRQKINVKSQWFDIWVKTISHFLWEEYIVTITITFFFFFLKIGGQKGGMLWSPNMQLYNRGPIITFPHPRTTLCTFYKHSQTRADLSRGIGDPHWEAATGITQLDPGLSISLPQTLKLSAAHRPRVVCWYMF